MRRLRAASASDLAPAKALLEEAGLPAAGLEDGFGDGFVVAEDGEGRLLGMAGIEVHGRDGLLRSAAVRRSQRGTGLGAQLTRDRLDRARGLGLESVYLLTTTAEDYWPRFGFEPIGRDDAPDDIRASEEWSTVCPASATAMRLRLNG